MPAKSAEAFVKGSLRQAKHLFQSGRRIAGGLTV